MVGVLVMVARRQSSVRLYITGVVCGMVLLSMVWYGVAPALGQPLQHYHPAITSVVWCAVVLYVVCMVWFGMWQACTCCG